MGRSHDAYSNISKWRMIGMLDYLDIIRRYPSNVSKRISSLVESVLNKNSGQQCFLFGRNELSAHLARIISVDGYIDEYSSESIWNGLPVSDLRSVDRQAIIINCVINSRPRTASSNISSAGFHRVLAYSDLCKVAPTIIPLPSFVADTRADIIVNSGKWAEVYDGLADSVSKKVLNDILHYRLTADSDVLKEYDFRVREQYFEDFMDYRNEVFVDAGGFDGDTTEQFCERYPDYKKVWLFEPSTKNMALAKTRLENVGSIEFLEQGVSDRIGTLSFNSNDGSASAVSATGGDSFISVTTLDHSVIDRVSFIKMDLEGWELKALAGSSRHIINDHPKLAIAVYHHPSDIWKIYNFIISKRPDYKVYLRHYTESWTETVMYFLPVL